MNLAGEKIPNSVSDFFSVRFQREVPGIEELDLRIGNTAHEGLGTGGRKNESFLPHTPRKRGRCTMDASTKLWKACGNCPKIV